ncbi:type VII secretion system-associated protein [Nucisporomicrobium flavum]|uniref:type VII secretion system-associated protein n=1 Tax=Nucisporomicrobium flavum TaxID=2785915 RepID=UPI0027DBABE2|nr:type VII secretion system-associated protein [Nucisporomicrobium flavum]
MQPELRDRDFFLLMDPDWRPGPGDDVPPLEAVIGAWPLDADGVPGPFRGNPRYAPRDGQAAADPLDAVLRLTMGGRMEAGQLQLMMRDAQLEVALNGDGRPLVVRSPDDVRCVVVATGPQQRRRVSAPEWRRMDLTGVVSLLPDEVDVLINPGGPVPFRLTGDFLRETMVMSDEDVAAAYDAFRGQDPGRGVEVLPWAVGEGR